MSIPYRFRTFNLVLLRLLSCRRAYFSFCPQTTRITKHRHFLRCTERWFVDNKYFIKVETVYISQRKMIFDKKKRKSKEKKKAAFESAVPSSPPYAILSRLN